jgi:hypothetical protein
VFCEKAAIEIGIAGFARIGQSWRRRFFRGGFAASPGPSANDRLRVLIHRHVLHRCTVTLPSLISGTITASALGAAVQRHF